MIEQELHASLKPFVATAVVEVRRNMEVDKLGSEPAPLIGVVEVEKELAGAASVDAFVVAANCHVDLLAGKLLSIKREAKIGDLLEISLLGELAEVPPVRDRRKPAAD